MEKNWTGFIRVKSAVKRKVLAMDKVIDKIDGLKDVYKTVDEVTTADLSSRGLQNITLRSYQLDGVNWLIQRYKAGHGCILGDEMGLGKTCQTISFMLGVSEKIKRPHIVLCPLSVLSNWQTELSKFAPSLTIISYMGDKDTRSNIQTDIHSQKSGSQFHFSVLLTTYEVCLKDEEFLGKIPWHLLVVDEAHRLKNHESKLHIALKSFEVEHRLLLTGTPIQNNLTELYSLLSFVAPKIFYRRYIDDFVEMFSDEKVMKKLHEILQPFLLRRVKSQVLKDLPMKSEIILYHGLSDLQKKYYKAILTKDIDAFEKNEMGVSKTRLMNILMQLRKCVGHPYLFDGVEPEPFELGEHLVTASNKLVLIDRLLLYLKRNGHKVLLFSQMTRMLDIIQDYLGYRGYSYERLDGSVRGEERFLAIQNFNKEDSTFVFLLSTKAGGVGLNLTSADTVIFVDSDFNPQNDLQAAARAHRIGQKRPVKIIRLIGQSTVEEIILRRAEAKLKLTNSVIEGGQFSLVKNKEDLIADDKMKLQDILKFGVDKLFDSDEDMDVDIDFDKILGATVNKKWIESTAEEPKKEEDVEASDETTDMYVFDGKDYKSEPSAADQEAMNKMIALEQSLRSQSLSENRGRRNKKMMLLQLPDQLPTRKPRKKLSAEELEERRKKRKEATERRAQEEEEEEIRQAQEQKKRIEEMWRKNDYTSSNIALDSEGESGSSGEDLDENEEGDDDDDEDEVLQISYVSGDVTHPQNTKNRDAIVVHCVDDSGSWGKGGLFTALSMRSVQPEELYTTAGKMKDLALGDSHIMQIDDIESRTDGKDWCALIVAQHRDRKNRLSGIKLTALSQGLQRIYKAAKQKKAGVHLPRIGYNTPGFNWYGTERLIRKHLAAKGIPTYIYYFPRKHAGKRKISTDSEKSDEKGNRSDEQSTSKRTKGRSVSSESSDSSAAVGTSVSSFPSIFDGISVYFHQIPDQDRKILMKYLIAGDGDVHSTVEDSTTHIVVSKDLSNQDKLVLSDICSDFPESVVITSDWMHECIKLQKLSATNDYVLQLKY